MGPSARLFCFVFFSFLIPNAFSVAIAKTSTEARFGSGNYAVLSINLNEGLGTYVGGIADRSEAIDKALDRCGNASCYIAAIVQKGCVAMVKSAQGLVSAGIGRTEISAYAEARRKCVQDTSDDASCGEWGHACAD